MRQQTPPGLAWEVVVVDNASTDDTYRVATQLAAGHPDVPFNVMQEPTPGKSYALDAGILAARFRYLIICDDDNWLDESYVSTAYALMQASPGAGVLGGLGEPVFESAPPAWFEKYASDYAAGPQGGVTGDITTSRGWVVGAGMVLNKQAWLRVKEKGYAGVLTCRKGDSLSAGGDVEMCYLLRLFGYSVLYDPRLRFKHFLPAQRLNWRYVTRLYEGSAEGSMYLQCYEYFLRNGANGARSASGIYWSMLKKGLVLFGQNQRLLWQVMRRGVPEDDRQALLLRYAYVRFKTTLLERSAVLRHIERVESLVADLRAGELSRKGNRVLADPQPEA